MTDLEILVSLHNIDVLCVSETWMSHNHGPTSASIHLPGFIVASRRDRPDRRGGGVLIYVRDNLPAVNLCQPIFA